MSRFLLTAAGSGQARELLDVERVGLEEGRARIAAGKATGLLILPKGFGTAIFEGTPATLQLVTNPAQRILPSLVTEGVEMTVEASFYVQRLLGEPLHRMIRSGDAFPRDEEVASISTEINRRLRSLDNVLLPPALTVVTEKAAARPSTPFAVLFFPGALLLSLLFIAEGMSGDIWREKNQGVLRRAASLPHPLTLFLGAKVAAGAVLMATVSTVGLLLASVIFGTPVLRVPLAIVWTTFAGGALLAFFLLLQTFASTERTANMLTMMVMFPLMMIGGSMFPFEAMPPWMAAVGRWTPNGLAVSRLKSVLAGAPDPAALLVAALVIGSFGLVTFAWAVRRARGPFLVG